MSEPANCLIPNFYYKSSIAKPATLGADSIIQLLYSGTINILPQKRISYNGTNQKWSLFSKEQQEAFLSSTVDTFCKDNNLKLIESEFETCPHLKMRHVHFYFEANYDFFCEYHNQRDCPYWKKLMMPNSKFHHVYFERTHTSSQAWIRYINKDQ